MAEPRLAIELCGSLADTHGRWVELSVPTDGVLVSDLISRLASAYPALRETLDNSRTCVCLNDIIASVGTLVRPDDRVAVFPPVSGG